MNQALHIATLANESDLGIMTLRQHYTPGRTIWFVIIASYKCTVRWNKEFVAKLIKLISCRTHSSKCTIIYIVYNLRSVHVKRFHESMLTQSRVDTVKVGLIQICSSCGTYRTLTH